MVLTTFPLASQQQQQATSNKNQQKPTTKTNKNPRFRTRKKNMVTSRHQRNQFFFKFNRHQWEIFDKMSSKIIIVCQYIKYYLQKLWDATS